MTGNALELSGNAAIENNVSSAGGGINFTGTANNMLYIRDDVKITGNTGNANGGGINAPNGSIVIAGNVEIANNTAATGGGIAFSGTGITVEDGVTVKDNTATRRGGGIYIDSTESDVSVHGLFQGNTSPKTGGIFIENLAQGSLDFSRARFVENISNGPEGDGGGLNYYRDTGDESTLPITLNNTVFDGNQSNRNGGGMEIDCYVSSTFNLSADGCRFENNVATNVGGGMYIYAPENSTVLVQNSTISKNKARSGGGGIVAQILSGQSTVTFGNVTISENEATIGAGGLYLGAGNQAITLSGVTFENNSAAQSGAGIEGDQGSGTLTINNGSKFISNHAGNEGGGFKIYNSKTVTLENVSFAQNTARVGNDFYNSSELRIGSSVKLPSGIYIENENSVPEIFQNLSADSVIQYEQSYYVHPDLGTPIVIANSDLSLTPQDAAAFRKPATAGFAGWEVKLSDDNKEVLIAPEVYAIAYENTKGAENPNPATYTVVTPTITLADLSGLTDYRFLGWYDAAEGGNRVTEITQGSTGDITLYARWQSLIHTVTYYGNDADGSPAENVPLPQDVNDGESVILSDESPTRTGYLFLSWNTAPDGAGMTYHPGDTISDVTADIDLYAIWQLLPPAEHVLAYHPNDDAESPAHGMPDNTTVIEGDTAHISTLVPTRDGFAFTGWNTDPSGAGTSYAPDDTIPDVRADIDLHAMWTPLPPPLLHTLTYYGNDAGGPPAQWIPFPVQVVDGQSVTVSPAIPTREGFVFIVWNTDPAGTGTHYRPGDTIADVRTDIGLFAQWVSAPPVPRTLTFYGNDIGGSRARGIPDPVTVADGQSVTLPYAIPTREGYRFIGWNTAPDGSGTAYLPGQIIAPVTSDFSLHAQWQALPPESFRVRFLPNACACEVCGMPQTLVIPENLSAVIPDRTPCRPCRCFIGWNTLADGCGIWYAAGQSVAVDRDICLFAQWC